MNISDLRLVEGIDEVLDKKPVTFINGDNIALLRYMREEMLRGYFHVGIVDPPYGISVGSMNLGATKDSKPRNYEMGNWDNEVPTLEYWVLLNYVCRELIIWGGNYFTDTFNGCYEVEYKDGHKEYLQNILKIKKELVADITWYPPVKSGRCFITWDKMNDKMSFAHGELALTTFDKNAVIIRRPRNAKTEEEQKERVHPTQKPIYLYDYLHLNFVERGQRVLDTHGGSHSHAIAAFKNNVNLTIIEREKSYFKSGVDAFDEISLKPRLLF